MEFTNVSGALFLRQDTLLETSSLYFGNHAREIHIGADTGQYSNMDDFGLMYYTARWYDPSLGRFTQADTIIPDGVQGYDRYAYVNNNPVRYNDPTGHQAYQGQGGDYTWEDQMNDAYVTQESEQAKCDAGNYNYCSGIDLIVRRHPKPVSGIHVEYSGQAGYGLEY